MEQAPRQDDAPYSANITNRFKDVLERVRNGGEYMTQGELDELREAELAEAAHPQPSSREIRPRSTTPHTTRATETAHERKGTRTAPKAPKRVFSNPMSVFDEWQKQQEQREEDGGDE